MRFDNEVIVPEIEFPDPQLVIQKQSWVAHSSLSDAQNAKMHDCTRTVVPKKIIWGSILSPQLVPRLRSQTESRYAQTQMNARWGCRASKFTWSGNKEKRTKLWTGKDERSDERTKVWT